MNKKVLYIALLALLLTSCVETSITQSDKPQVCPAWTKYDQATCKVKLMKADLATNGIDRDINLNDWDQARFTVVNGDVIIDGAVNVEICTDFCDEIDPITERLLSGTYIAKKISLDQPAKFKITNPHSGNRTVTISVEFVKKIDN